MSIFTNLTEEEAMSLYNKFIAEGMDKDEAFNEVYSIECNLDEEV